MLIWRRSERHADRVLVQPRHALARDAFEIMVAAFVSMAETVGVRGLVASQLLCSLQDVTVLSNPCWLIFFIVGAGVLEAGVALDVMIFVMGCLMMDLFGMEK